MPRRKPTVPRVASEGEETLALHLGIHKLPYTREFRFDPARKWRVDFLVGKDLAVEVEGGTWSGGRHVRGAGYSADLAKYNSLTRLGYRLLRYSTEMVISGQAIDEVREVLAQAVH
ncbi:MAG TPA: hypothetical protein VN666_21755 [Nitrospira sp.]|nr:hypothetical protein [Nitrospira sp.]